MNVFILNTGRCGSMTFTMACRHIINFTSAHESRIDLPGPQRLQYPDNHIEADNRLSWFLGRLEQHYGDQAIYVHLKRERQATIDSFIKREDFGIMQAYRNGIYLNAEQQPIDILATDYGDSVNANIEQFLSNKTRTMTFHLETAETDFRTFWELIGAEGDLDSALKEWQITHNKS